MRELLRLLAALAGATAFGYPLLLAGGRPVVFVGLLAAGALVNALVLWSDGAVTLAAAALAGLYLTALTVGGVGTDPLAPLVGALLVVFVELCDTALGVPPLRPVDRALLGRTLAHAAWTLLLGVAAGALVLGAALLVPAGSPLLRALAMAALVAVVGVPVLGQTRGRGRAGVG